MHSTQLLYTIECAQYAQCTERAYNNIIFNMYTFVYTERVDTRVSTSDMHCVHMHNKLRFN